MKLTVILTFTVCSDEMTLISNFAVKVMQVPSCSVSVTLVRGCVFGMSDHGCSHRTL